MFTWNGTEVTDIIKESIIEEGIHENIIYWRITWKNLIECCIVRNLTNGVLPCLIDEIKPIFKLEKIGTHWTKCNGKKLLLLRVKLNEEGSIVTDLQLDQFYHSKIAKDVQRIFVFRDLLGMSKSYEKSIVLRIKKNFVVPISFYDPNMEPSSCVKVVPNTVLDKWFKNTTLEQELKRMLDLEKLEDISKILYELRIKLEKIVVRCDPDSITLVDEILSRIGSRMQYILDK